MSQESHLKLNTDLIHYLAINDEARKHYDAKFIEVEKSLYLKPKRETK